MYLLHFGVLKRYKIYTQITILNMSLLGDKRHIIYLELYYYTIFYFTYYKYLLGIDIFYTLHKNLAF